MDGKPSELEVITGRKPLGPLQLQHVTAAMLRKVTTAILNEHTAFAIGAVSGIRTTSSPLGVSLDTMEETATAPRIRTVILSQKVNV